MLFTHGINPPYWKMTRNRSGKAERDNPALPPLRATPATVQMTPGRRDMMALTRGGVKDSHE
jgi:hypothetical protein